MKLEKGKKYKYPSGLGGMFDIKYIKYDVNRKQYIFKNVSPGFEEMPQLKLSTNDLKDVKPCV